MFKTIVIAAASVFALQLGSSPVLAASVFPSSGSFTEANSESQLDFGKRYLGFPDEECKFSQPQRLGPKKWRVTTTCTTADPPKTSTSTATLEKRARGWRYRKSGFKIDFK